MSVFIAGLEERRAHMLRMAEWLGMLNGDSPLFEGIPEVSFAGVDKASIGERDIVDISAILLARQMERRLMGIYGV